MKHYQVIVCNADRERVTSSGIHFDIVREFDTISECVDFCLPYLSDGFLCDFKDLFTNECWF